MSALGLQYNLSEDRLLKEERLIDTRIKLLTTQRKLYFTRDTPTRVQLEKEAESLKQEVKNLRKELRKLS